VVLLAMTVASAGCDSIIRNALHRGGITSPNQDAAPPLPQNEYPGLATSSEEKARLMGEISGEGSTKQCFYRSAHSIRLRAVPTGATCPTAIRVRVP
jgi:hypothetical protein